MDSCVIVERAAAAEDVVDDGFLKGSRDRYPGGWLFVQQICEGCSCSQTTIVACCTLGSLFVGT